MKHWQVAGDTRLEICHFLTDALAILPTSIHKHPVCGSLLGNLKIFTICVDRSMAE